METIEICSSLQTKATFVYKPIKLRHGDTVNISKIYPTLGTITFTRYCKVEFDIGDSCVGKFCESKFLIGEIPLTFKKHIESEVLSRRADKVLIASAVPEITETDNIWTFPNDILIASAVPEITETDNIWTFSNDTLTATISLRDTILSYHLLFGVGVLNDR